MNKRAEFAECRSCPCTASRIAARGITATFDRHLRPHGLRATQFTILTNLILRGPTSIGVLAKALGLERTTLTRNIAILAQNGWARDDSNPKDARTHILSVTPAGETIAREALGAWREAQRRIVSLLGESGMNALQGMAELPLRS